MLAPKRTKFRKQQRGRRKGISKKGKEIVFGDWALQALEPVWLTDRQIESCRMALTHTLKRGGRVWLRVFPDKPFTKKPAETRMGKGKGEPDHWVCVVRTGRIIAEIGGVEEEVAKHAMKSAGAKLPIRTRILRRDSMQN